MARVYYRCCFSIDLSPCVKAIVLSPGIISAGAILFCIKAQTVHFHLINVRN